MHGEDENYGGHCLEQGDDRGQEVSEGPQSAAVAADRVLILPRGHLDHVELGERASERRSGRPRVRIIVEGHDQVVDRGADEEVGRVSVLLLGDYIA